MKLMICGKGGSGKSTVAALVAMEMEKRGKRVLLVDVDESNIGLYRMFGLEMPQPLMDSFGGKKGFNEKAKAAGIGLGAPPALFPKAMGIGELPEACVARKSNIHILSVGKIHHFGEGCACPMGRLFRMLFASLRLAEDDVVIVDTTAGVEHFGRRLDDQCDRVLCVIDPSFESITLAGKVAGFGKEMNLPVSFVLNKVSPEIQEQLEQSLDGLAVIGSLPQDPAIFLNTLKGESINAAVPGVDKICDALNSHL